MKTIIETCCLTNCPVSDWCARSAFSWQKAGLTPSTFVHESIEIVTGHRHFKVKCNGYVPKHAQDYEYGGAQ